MAMATSAAAVEPDVRRAHYAAPVRVRSRAAGRSRGCRRVREAEEQIAVLAARRGAPPHRAGQHLHRRHRLVRTPLRKLAASIPVRSPPAEGDGAQLRDTQRGQSVRQGRGDKVFVRGETPTVAVRRVGSTSNTPANADRSNSLATGVQGGRGWTWVCERSRTWPVVARRSRDATTADLVEPHHSQIPAIAHELIQGCGKQIGRTVKPGQ